MAVYVVAQDTWRRCLYDHVPAPERWQLRSIWLSYRETHLTIEWQVREELRIGKELLS